jgi:hypothetical protein
MFARYASTDNFDFKDSQGNVLDSDDKKTSFVETTTPVIEKKIQIVGTSPVAIDAGDVTGGCLLKVFASRRVDITSDAIISVGKIVSSVFVEDFQIRATDPPLVIPYVSDLSVWRLQSNTSATGVRVLLIKRTDPV